MNIIVAPRLLIKSVPPPGDSLALMGGKVPFRELCPNEMVGLGKAAAPVARWYLVELGTGVAPPSAADVWDAAHEAAQQHNAYTEPDIGVEWDYRNPVCGVAIGAAPGELCSYNDQSTDFPKGKCFAWHLDSSQLRTARD